MNTEQNYDLSEGRPAKLDCLLTHLGCWAEAGAGDGCVFLRAANKAASLTRFAKSAPENPGVPRATVVRLTSFASGTFLHFGILH